MGSYLSERDPARIERVRGSRDAIIDRTKQEAYVEVKVLWIAPVGDGVDVDIEHTIAEHLGLYDASLLPQLAPCSHQQVCVFGVDVATWLQPKA